MENNELARVPFNERTIPYRVAEEYIRVSDSFLQLEGLNFDKEGNLYFCDVFSGGLYEVPAGTKAVEKLLTFENGNPAAVKVGPDGRLYVCCLGNMVNNGSLIAVDPKTLEKEVLIDSARGYVIDDMAFVSDGFYFTHFVGNSGDLSGGIYKASIDGKTIRPFMLNMNTPNGIAATNDGKALWITEMGAGRLHFVEIGPDGRIPPYGSMVPYNFTGLNGPDSCCLDKKGNLYVAMYNQGRVLCFSSFGQPLGQILLPGSWNGKYLRSTHPMVTLDGENVLICANDGPEGEGASIFVSKAF